MARRSAHSAVQSALSQSSTSDDGDESQRVIALDSLLQTPKTNHKELQDFKAKVAADRQELKTLLGQCVRRAEQASVRRHHKLTEAILGALQTPNRPVQGTPPTFGESKIVRNAVLKSVASVLTASRELVHEYDRLDKMVVGIREAEPEGVAESWAEEVNRTAKLLKIGAETATKHVQKVLGADVEGGDTKGSTLVEDGETMEALERMELNCELHKGLVYAERGIKKMIKGLSEPEQG
ncbi:hypothetical protein E8E12_003608 [Didymella heteroderae]|uniref:Uncharacterized protein n=1 Tax=Didymella heteroderae TaxID=1769908 RepID=A0A9P4WP31_9PLEO|nr:hypothetical protein E8E12_003608 [Didymella heteroderae]